MHALGRAAHLQGVCWPCPLSACAHASLHGAFDDRAVYCSCQKQTSYTFRGYVLKRDVTKFQGYTLLAV